MSSVVFIQALYLTSCITEHRCVSVRLRYRIRQDLIPSTCGIHPKQSIRPGSCNGKPSGAAICLRPPGHSLHPSYPSHFMRRRCCRRVLVPVRRTGTESGLALFVLCICWVVASRRRPDKLVASSVLNGVLWYTLAGVLCRRWKALIPVAARPRLGWPPITRRDFLIAHSMCRSPRLQPAPRSRQEYRLSVCSVGSEVVVIPAQSFAARFHKWKGRSGVGVLLSRPAAFVS